MPVMKVLRANLPWEFCFSTPVAHPPDQGEQSLAGFMEDLEAVCLKEDTDCWKDEPIEKQRKLRLEQ